MHMWSVQSNTELDGMPSGILGLGVVGAYVKLVETVEFATL